MIIPFLFSDVTPLYCAMEDLGLLRRSERCFGCNKPVLMKQKGRCPEQMMTPREYKISEADLS